MIFKGTLSEIKEEIVSVLDSLTIQKRNSFAVSLSFSEDEREIIFFDKQTPRIPIYSSEQLSSAAQSGNLCSIDKEIYIILTNPSTPKSMEPKTGPASIPNVSEPNLSPVVHTKTIKNKTKTESQKPKTIARKNETRKPEKNIPIDSTENYIQSYISDEARAKSPCAIGIKRVQDNIYYAYYRSSIYDKGADTTFRHYLVQQPGELVAYIYFRKVENLRRLFESLGKKLRKNGNNCLSYNQVESIIETLTRLLIY